jgi:hypothetical protein
MHALFDRPLLIALAAGLLFATATAAGVITAALRRPLDEGQREDFNLVLGATLTLLSLIIGFSFSMAINRYDQRKSLEEAEANAVGTEYVRCDFLAAPFAAEARSLLRDYARLRVAFYSSRDVVELKGLESRTVGLQDRMWAAVVAGVRETPNPLGALAVSGMNDVLNSQGYTQAAWWNRIPAGAWVLMATIGSLACGMVGFGARAARREPLLMLTMPVIVAISMFLIADIDSPRGGVIQVAPQNLIALLETLK